MDVAEQHQMDKPCNPNENAWDFSAYLSVHDQWFDMKADSCLCKACYTDALKHCNQGASTQEPRKVKLHSLSLELSEYCPLCHNDWFCVPEGPCL